MIAESSAINADKSHKRDVSERQEDQERTLSVRETNRERRHLTDRRLRRLTDLRPADSAEFYDKPAERVKTNVDSLQVTEGGGCAAVISVCGFPG